MRLLIVEDEYYTRQGIVDGVDFPGLGITEVVQADDGIHALEAAEAMVPDIVISDVRMPRMDGIAMARELARRNPACRFIFMSGFADREYLKAAIELKAVSFVDKPFRTPELRDAVKAAVSSLRAERETRLIADTGAPLVQAAAALELVRQGADVGKAARTLEALGIRRGPRTPMTAAALRSAGDARALSADLRRKILVAASNEAARAGCACAGAFTAEGPAALVFINAGTGQADSILSRLASAFPEAGLLAGVGTMVTDLADIARSYSRALDVLDGAFFRPDASGGGRGVSLGVGDSAFDDFRALLDREDGPGIHAFLEEAAARMRESGSADARGAREFLSGLLSRLLAFARRRGIDPLEPGESEASLIRGLEGTGTLNAALGVVSDRAAALMRMAQERRGEGGPVFEARRFIRRSFASPDLSVGDIARAVGLSEAYVCRLFHEATGMTVHEYIAECRMERAKELLSAGNPMKMTEVAARAGFSDANYFAKAFRKATGCAPSEYREGGRA